MNSNLISIAHTRTLNTLIAFSDHVHFRLIANKDEDFNKLFCTLKKTLKAEKHFSTLLGTVP